MRLNLRRPQRLRVAFLEDAPPPKHKQGIRKAIEIGQRKRAQIFRLAYVRHQAFGTTGHRARQVQVRRRPSASRQHKAARGSSASLTASISAWMRATIGNKPSPAGDSPSLMRTKPRAALSSSMVPWHSMRGAALLTNFRDLRGPPSPPDGHGLTTRLDRRPGTHLPFRLKFPILPEIKLGHAANFTMYWHLGLELGLIANGERGPEGWGSSEPSALEVGR